MEFSAFNDKADKPRDEALSSVLGRSRSLWDALRRQLADDFNPVAEEWKYAGKNYGWSLQLKRGKRAIVYLTPCRKFFRASFAIGDRAAAAAHEQALPDAILSLIDGAQKYAEGRAVRIEVKTKRDVENVKKLAAVKMAN